MYHKNLVDISFPFITNFFFIYIQEICQKFTEYKFNHAILNQYPTISIDSVDQILGNVKNSINLFALNFEKMNMVVQQTRDGYSGRSSFDMDRGSKSRFFNKQIKDFSPINNEDKSAFDERKEVIDTARTKLNFDADLR